MILHVITNERFCCSPKRRSIHTNHKHPSNPNNEMNAGMGCDCADDLLAQKEKNKLLQEEMESTLQDIQNM